MLKQDPPDTPTGWRSAFRVLSMPLGYAAACATMAAAASLILLLEAPAQLELIPSWRSAPGEAAYWLVGAIAQLTLVGIVLAAPVAMPVMIIFRHREVRSARSHALAGALVVAGAALFLRLVLGLAIRPFEVAILIAVGPLAGLVYWFIASRHEPRISAAPPGSD
jgi:hypothetical protein